MARVSGSTWWGFVARRESSDVLSEVGGCAGQRTQLANLALATAARNGPGECALVCAAGYILYLSLHHTELYTFELVDPKRERAERLPPTYIHHCTVILSCFSVPNNRSSRTPARNRTLDPPGLAISCPNLQNFPSFLPA